MSPVVVQRGVRALLGLRLGGRRAPPVLGGCTPKQLSNVVADQKQTRYQYRQHGMFGSALSAGEMSELTRLLGKVRTAYRRR